MSLCLCLSVCACMCATVALNAGSHRMARPQSSPQFATCRHIHMHQCLCNVRLYFFGTLQTGSQQHIWPSSMAAPQCIHTPENTTAGGSVICIHAGCTLGSAIAAELAKGHEPLTAVQRAKAWLGEALQASAPLHIGTGPHRPLNHG